MTYNLFIGYGMGSYNILAIPKKHLDIAANAWLKGDTEFYLSGQKYNCEYFNSLQIFTNAHEKSKSELEEIQSEHGSKRGFFHRYFSVNQLEELGENLTDEILGDQKYGSHKEAVAAVAYSEKDFYISQERINALRSLNEEIEFDLNKLIILCEEINDNYQRENYYSVMLLLRTILNHIPPAFNNKDTFDQVLAELNGKEHKTKREIFSRLQELQRKLADLMAHERLRKIEPKIVAQDVQFIPEINFLLKEAFQVLSIKKT